MLSESKMEFYNPEALNYYSSMPRGFLPEQSNYHQASTAIDRDINMELQSMKNVFALEEEAFVEEMMAKHPIVVERRKNLLDGERSIESIQRAESCRKSRVNNKIKKTKMRLRHQFASQKMKESSTLLNHIHELIVDVEGQLIRSGFPIGRLSYLRDQFGMDQPPASPVLWQSFRYS